MAKPYIINALDIGTSSIKILSILKKPGEDDFEVLTYRRASSLGTRKGVVIDVSKVGEIINSLIEKAREDCGRNINNLYVSIGGVHLFCTCSHGLISVSRADQKVSEEDIERVLQAARTFPLPSHKEIIEVFPKEFIVDGEGNIKEPLGMQGVRLEAKILALCGFSPYLKKSSQAVLNAGVQLNDLVPSPLASSQAVLTYREKELGVALLDIGAGTTGMAVFEEGSLIHFSVFPVGSGNITNDIAICLKTDIDTAERIKLEFGTCRSIFSRGAKNSEKTIKIGSQKQENEADFGEETVTFSKKSLADIIEARVSEIFDLVNKELKKISRQGMLPAGIVLTGGGAKLPGIRELAKKQLKLPCRIGTARQFSSVEQDPSLSTVCGLIMEAIDLEEGNGDFQGLGKGIKDKLKKAFRVFIP